MTQLVHVDSASIRTSQEPVAVPRKVLIKNYHAFKDFKLELSRGVNIIVGSNDAGKSTLLEAINLAFTAGSGRSRHYQTCG